MTTTIPRAELHAVAMRHHDEDMDRDCNVSVDWVRSHAAELHSYGDAASIAEADDLDALADRYEREAAQ